MVSASRARSAASAARAGEIAGGAARTLGVCLVLLPHVQIAPATGTPIWGSVTEAAATCKLAAGDVPSAASRVTPFTAAKRRSPMTAYNSAPLSARSCRGGPQLLRRRHQDGDQGTTATRQSTIDGHAPPGRCPPRRGTRARPVPVSPVVSRTATRPSRPRPHGGRGRGGSRRRSDGSGARAPAWDGGMASPWSVSSGRATWVGTSAAAPPVSPSAARASRPLCAVRRVCCPPAQIRASRVAVSIARSSKRTKTLPVRRVARALRTAGSACRVITRRRSSASERAGRCTRRRPGSAWRTVAGARAGLVIVHLAIWVTPGRPGMTGNVR